MGRPTPTEYFLPTHWATEGSTLFETFGRDLAASPLFLRGLWRFLLLLLLPLLLFLGWRLGFRFWWCGLRHFIRTRFIRCRSRSWGLHCFVGSWRIPGGSTRNGTAGLCSWSGGPVIRSGRLRRHHAGTV